MSYKAIRHDFNDAKSLIKSYKYALIYEISCVNLGFTTDIEDINWDELTEARFFSEDSELHFVCDDDKYAIQISDEEEENAVKREYLLSGRFKSIGNSIVVKQYLNEDEDGQMIVAMTRLAGIN